MKKKFQHDYEIEKKQVDALGKFKDPKDTIYHMFKDKLEHSNFYYDQDGLRVGDDKTNIIDHQVYNFNSLGYRAREFSKENPGNTLVFGCSTSFGQGVPEDQAWSNQFAKLKGIDVLNLSLPGKGVSRYFEDFLIYCNEYGKPKNVIVLVADLYRLRFLNDTEHHTAYGSQSKVPGKIMVPLAMEDLFLNNWDTSLKDKYTEIPFDTKDYISPYYGIYQNVWSMYAFEAFCKAAGINLFWSTYNRETKDVIKELIKNKPIFEKFLIDNDLLVSEQLLSDSCEETHNNIHHGTDLWEFGTDAPWKGRSHPGVHLHTHVAEFFNRHLGVDDEGNLHKIQNPAD
jgi:hypothetical protein